MLPPSFHSFFQHQPEDLGRHVPQGTLRQAREDCGGRPGIAAPEVEAGPTGRADRGLRGMWAQGNPGSGTWHRAQ